MINCVRDDKKTVVSASGDASRIAADCCEVIRAIYFEIPVEVRPLYGGSGCRSIARLLNRTCSATRGKNAHAFGCGMCPRWCQRKL